MIVLPTGSMLSVLLSGARFYRDRYRYLMVLRASRIALAIEWLLLATREGPSAASMPAAIDCSGWRRHRGEPRLRTHCGSQNVRVAAIQIAEKKACAHRS